jgi:hypothetical protein
MARFRPARVDFGVLCASLGNSGTANERSLISFNLPHAKIATASIGIRNRDATAMLKTSLGEPGVVVLLVVCCSSLPRSEKPKSFISSLAFIFDNRNRMIVIVSGAIEIQPVKIGSQNRRIPPCQKKERLGTQMPNVLWWPMVPGSWLQVFG